MDQKTVYRLRSKIYEAEQEVNNASTGITNSRLVLLDDELVNVNSKTLRRKRSEAVIVAKRALYDLVDDLPWIKEGSGSKDEARMRKKTPTKERRTKLLRRIAPQQHRQPKPVKENTPADIMRDTYSAQHTDERP